MRSCSLLVPLVLSRHAQALPPLSVLGNRFVDPANRTFLFRGVDYQPGGASAYSPFNRDDPLTDPVACYRDATVLRLLGANAIRVYNLHVDANHDECVSIFNAAGIYLLLDVNSPIELLHRYEPWLLFGPRYLTRVFRFISAFHHYPNVAGFFAANEVVNDAVLLLVSPPFVRAVQRDMKQYIATVSPRPIPVGYAAVDDTLFRGEVFRYLLCRASDNSHADFYGINLYLWCAPDLFSTSGYAALEDIFGNASMPVVFSEYGCNTITPRPFREVLEGIFGPLALFASGGLAYEYSREPNNYGLVEIIAGQVRLLEDWYHLQRQFAQVQAVLVLVQHHSPESCGCGDECNLPELEHTAMFSAKQAVRDLELEGRLVDVSKWIHLAPTPSVVHFDGTPVTGLQLC